MQPNIVQVEVEGIEAPDVLALYRFQAQIIFQSAFHAVCQNEPSAQVAAGALPVGICMIMLLEGVFIITLISSKRHIALHFKMIKRNS
ncbi:hypothetical protein [Flavonifractor plautii]|uniref:hypothetical protein n=1 Tax=Flavonifractor plautii TaxID=292800 RepID=UPI0018AAF95B|nr:hypothetical protein [Flavonifractor plautii]